MNIPEETQRRMVVVEALSWLGTPYHHHGRVKGAGVDCGMFLAEVYERMGILPHVDPGFYDTDWHLHKSEEKYLNLVKQFASKVDGPEPGDIALFKYGHCASHGAIVVKWPQIVHSYFGIGVVLDDAKLNYELSSRFVGAWSPWSK